MTDVSAGSTKSISQLRWLHGRRILEEERRENQAFKEVQTILFQQSCSQSFKAPGCQADTEYRALLKKGFDTHDFSLIERFNYLAQYKTYLEYFEASLEYRWLMTMNENRNRTRMLYEQPIFDLLYQAHQIHRQWHGAADVQKCVLLSIKTGGCPEDCGYCSQSAHHSTDLQRQPLISVDEVRTAAQRAKQVGADRFCMGAAWRNAPFGEQFERVLEMIKVVKEIGLEACATLGMLDTEQAQRLKDAGLDAYNHNLDTSRTFYGQVVSTRTYEDRLNTIQAVRRAGIAVCCGGILGLGESVDDRCELLSELASLDPHPESVPINLLVPIAGTPLAQATPVETTELIRTIAVARILMPRSRVRLAAGRLSLNCEAQLLAFFAGANSIFVGDKLLTTPNVTQDLDTQLLEALA